MNVAINGRFLAQDITGVQRYAIELTKALDFILASYPEIKVTLIAPKNARDFPLRNISYERRGRLNGHLWEQVELPAFVRGRLLFCPANTAPIASLMTQRTVVTIHDLSYRYFPEAYSTAFRMLYETIVPLVMKFSNAVITVSKSERQSIIQHYPAIAGRLHAVANGGLPPDATMGSEPADPALPSGYVLYVGSLSKRKGYPNVLEAAQRLIASRGFRFLIVGGTAGGILDAKAAVSAEHEQSITFVGQVNDTNTLVTYFRNAACLLFPSHYESSGLPPIEAMACGCPVIASNIPALRERCGDAALYCDPNDIDTITAAVETMVDQPAKREELRAAGLERAAIYTWERCARETLEIIRQASRLAHT